MTRMAHTMGRRMTTRYDLAVIGGGSGGLAAARRAAEHGASVVLAEGSALGGTCVNVGCVPKKVMWEASSLHETLTTHAGVYGMEVEEGGWKVDMGGLVAKRNAYVKRLNGIYESALTSAGNEQGKGGSITLLGDAAALAVGEEGSVEGIVALGGAADDVIAADKVVIATGGAPWVPESIEGAREFGSTSDSFFEWHELPGEVAVVGGGYIGLELAGILATLGSDVDLLVRKNRVVPLVDPAIGAVLDETLVKTGVNVRMETEPGKVYPDPRTGKLVVESPAGDVLGSWDKVLFATGRKPEIASLGLEKAGVEVDTRSGRIVVDEHHQTSQTNVYALGDVANTPGDLTPVAIKAGRTLAERLFNPAAADAPPLDYSTIPTVMFTHPPIGAVGLTESQAAETYGHDNIKVYSARFVNLFFGLHDPEEKEPTLVKLVVNTADNERVLGVHGIGRGMDEAIQGFAVAVSMGATKADFDRTFPIHPTAAEEFVTLR